MSRIDRESMPYRDCVGTAVFNAEGLVFIGRRKPEEDPEDSSEHGSPWQMPQGGIDKGEDPHEAALRELYEETSIRSVQLIAEAPGWIYYDLPDDARPAQPGRVHDGVALAAEIGQLAELDRVALPGGKPLEPHDIAFANAVLLASGDDHGFHRAASSEWCGGRGPSEAPI